MTPMSFQPQKVRIFLYTTKISIIKLGNEQCLAPGKVKQQLYEALILTNVLVDFMVRKEENVTSLANST